MRLKELHGELPQYRWRAERHGMGYRYIGDRDGRPSVKVFAVAQLCGPMEDDYTTRWMVDDGTKTQDYASFWMTTASGEDDSDEDVRGNAKDNTGCDV